MLWPTVQLIENHWSGRTLDSPAPPRHAGAEIRAWPIASRRIAEPACSLGEMQAGQDCKQIQSSL